MTMLGINLDMGLTLAPRTLGGIVDEFVSELVNFPSDAWLLGQNPATGAQSGVTQAVAAFSVRFDAATDGVASTVLWAAGGPRIELQKDGANRLSARIGNSFRRAGISLDTDYLALYSWEAGGTQRLIIIDTSDGTITDVGSAAVALSETIDMTSLQFIAGASNVGGAAPLIGELERVSFWAGSYVDVSLPATQALFFDGGELVDPAVSIAALGTPLVHMAGRDIVTGTNTGSGGDFTSAGAGVLTVFIEGNEPDYDVLVSTISELQDVLDGTTAVPTGGVVALAPVVFDMSGVSFSSQPSDVTYLSQFMNDQATITGWDMRSSAGSGALTIQDMIVDYTLPTNEVGFWGPEGITLNAILNADGPDFSEITVQRLTATGGMERFLDGGRMTHNNTFLYVRDASDITVRDNVIQKVMGGVYLDSVNNATIEGNEIFNMHADPINLQQSQSDCQGILIRNNHMHSPAGDTGNFHSDGIQMQPVKSSGFSFVDIEIHGNTATMGTLPYVAQVDPATTFSPHVFREFDTTAADVLIDLSGSTWQVLSNAAGSNNVIVSRTGSDTIDGGTASVSIASGDTVLFAYAAGNWTTTVFATSTLSDAIADLSHGLESRFEPTGGMSINIPSAVGNRGEQFSFRYGSGAGSVTLVLDGSDTWDGGSGPVLSAAGDFATLVSDGAGNWEKLDQGYRAWMLPRAYDFTSGPLEDQMVVKLDGRGGDVDMTLPEDGAYEFNVMRVDSAANVVRVIAGAGDTIFHNGSSVTEITFSAGYGLTIERDDDGNWTTTEQPPTFAFLFSNNNDGNWQDIAIHGNVWSLPGSAIRIEDEIDNALVYNNSSLPFIIPDQNGDGVIGVFEGNQTSQLTEVSSANGVVQNNATAGTISNGTDGAIPAEVGNFIETLSDSDPIPAAITDAWNGTTRTDFVGTTRADVIAASLAKVGGPLDGTFIGASGTTAANGYYDWDAGEVNAAAVLPSPEITTFTPLHQSTEIGLDKAITLLWTQAVEAGTGDITIRANGSDVEVFDVATGTGDNGGTVVIERDTVTITAGADFALDTTYAVQIDATAVVGVIYGTTFAGISDDVSYTFDTATNALSVASAITDSANNSPDHRYARAVVDRDGYDWIGAAEQSIDSTLSSGMAAATVTALETAGSFVMIADLRLADGASGSQVATQTARGIGGTAYNETVSFNVTSGGWVTAPGSFWDSAGFSDVSSIYGVSSGTVYRVFISWTHDGTDTRQFTVCNDASAQIDARRYCVFDRATFAADDATMATEIAGLAP